MTKSTKISITDIEHCDLDSSVEKLEQIAAKPDRQSPEYVAWIEQRDFLSFLRAERQREEVVLYSGLSHCFLHGIVVPSQNLTPDNVDDLLDWNCPAPFSSWEAYPFFLEDSSENRVWIKSPLGSWGSKTLASGEQLLFIRKFDGYPNEDRTYVELSQKVAHLLGLHLALDRMSYCNLDDKGDVTKAVRIHKLHDAHVITIKREVLDMLLLMLKSSYVLLFDSTRFDPEKFNGWGNEPAERITMAEENLYYLHRTITGRESYLRGFQVTEPVINERLRRRLMGKSPEPRKYETFIAYDWKRNLVFNCSCDPDDGLANHFITFESFFRPEVTVKYRNCPSKYTLDTQHIHCRDTWSIKYYTNAKHQVHVHLSDLACLPYDEQIYWKSFNEKPKAAISEQVSTELSGRFDACEDDPLISLKMRLEKLNREMVEWWQLKDSTLLHRVQYPFTDEQEEWAKELMNLGKLVIEGLNKCHFESTAKLAGIKVSPQWRSLTLISEILLKAEVDSDKATAIVEPLDHLRRLRNQAAHASESEATENIRELIKQHGSLRSQFRALVKECDRAIDLMVEFANAEIF